MLTYTIGFIQRGNEILVLNRNFMPMEGCWHGVGGKLLPGEDPIEGMRREILEETGIRLDADQLRFSGIVTWQEGTGTQGMYAFIAEMDEEFRYPTPIGTDEGILAWKTMDWLCSPDNQGVGEHVKRFLPIMLYDRQIHEFRCAFKANKLTSFEAMPLYEEASLT